MKYRYKIVSVPVTTNLTTLENQMNTNGQTGWEIVSIVVVGTNFIIFAKKLLTT